MLDLKAVEGVPAKNLTEAKSCCVFCLAPSPFLFGSLLHNKEQERSSMNKLGLNEEWMTENIVNVYIYIYVRTFLYIYIYTYTYMYMYLNIYIYVHTHMYNMLCFKILYIRYVMCMHVTYVQFKPLSCSSVYPRDVHPSLFVFDVPAVRRSRAMRGRLHVSRPLLGLDSGMERDVTRHAAIQWHLLALLCKFCRMLRSALSKGASG